MARHAPSSTRTITPTSSLALEHALGAALDEQLEGFGAELFATVQEVAAGWSGQIRKDLLVRYLGFPLWDAILFPVQSVADIGERDTIEITRFSPDEAKAVGSSGAKLAGAHDGSLRRVLRPRRVASATTSWAACTAPSA